MKFKSNIEVQAGIEDKDGQVGSNGQILASTGSQVDWIDQGTISAESAEVVEVPVKNVHTATILKGTPVYISGSIGSSGRLEVKPADASVAGSMPALGLLKQDLAVNAEGLCVITGKLRNLITSPIDGVTTNDGDVVYVKAGGGLTTTKPTGSANLIQNMGKVGVSSTSNNGTFVVSSILRSNDVPNLTTGKIWVGDGNTIESSVVFLDEPNGRMGIGTTSPGAKLDVNGTFKANTFASIQGVDTGNPTAGVDELRVSGYGIMGNRGALYFTNSDSTGNIQFGIGGAHASSTKMYIANNGNVGIGTTSPSQKLDVDGSVNIDGTLFVNTNNNHIRLIDTDNTGNFSVGVNSNFQIRDITANTTPLTIRAGTPDNTILTTASGRVGISQNSPGVTLHVGGFTRIDGGLQMNTANATIYQILDSALRFGTNNTERMRIDSSGNVGIGTTNPLRKLHVVGNFAVNAGTGEYYGVNITGGEGADPNILIGDWHNSSANIKWDSSGNYLRIDAQHNTSGAPIVFSGNDSAIEYMRIDPSGNVGIGTTSPDYLLDVEGSVNNADIAIRINNTFDDNLATSNPTSVLWLNAASNNGYLRVHGAPANTAAKHQIDLGSTAGSSFLTFSPGGAERMRIATNGAIQFNDYGAGTLVTDSSGNITVSSGGGAGGPYLPLAAGSSYPLTDTLFGTNTSMSGNGTYVGSMNLGNGGGTGEKHLTIGNGSTGNGYRYIDLVGDTTYTDYGLRIIRGNSGANTSSQIVHRGTGDFSLQTTEAGKMRFVTANSERMRITSTGDIGIGTSSPAELLNVNKENAESVILISRGGTNPAASTDIGKIKFASDYNNVVTEYGHIKTYANSLSAVRGSMNFSVKSTSGAVLTGMTVHGTSAGVNVGIGTTSPDVKLQINHTGGNNGIRIISPNDVNGFLQFGDSDDDNVGRIVYGHSNDSMQFVTNDAERMRITNTGNVGIGTTSPGSKLEISSTSDALLELNGGVTANPYMLFAQNGTRRAFIQYVNGGLLSLASEYGDIRFMTGTGGADTEKMRIKDDGNVGIGTTNPGARLDVDKSAIIGSESTANSTTNIENVLKVKGKNNYSDGTTWYGDYGQILLSATNNMTSSARQFLITNALDNSKFAIIRSTDWSTPPLTNSTATGVNSGTADFVIDNVGNVGIGTTSPQTALQVGATTGDNFITLSGGSTGSEYGINWSFNNPTTSKYSSIKMNWDDRDTKGLQFNTLSGYRFSFNTQTSAGVYVGNLVTILGSGNVGIGTTSPSAKLEVNGQTVINSTLATNKPGLMWFNNQTEIFSFEDNSGAGELLLLSSNSVKVKLNANGNSYLNGGNVGIGITSPSSKLQVYSSTVGQYMEVGAGDGGGRSLVFTSSDNNGSAGALHTINAKSINGAIALSTSGNERMRITNTGNVGIGNTAPGNGKLVVTSGIDGPLNTVRIQHTRDEANVSTNALEIDMNLSGADTTTADRTNKGMHVDLDSSADGDASNEHRIHGIGSTVNFTGFSDIVRAGNFYAESGNITEKTAQLVGVYGQAVHDANSVNGGVSNMYGAIGHSDIQDLGDVDNAFGGYFLVTAGPTRGNADIGVTKGVEGEIQIDKASAINYGDMIGVSSIIDNNEGTVPNFGNQYLFKGDYQGDKGSNAYGIYVEGDKHYFDGNVGIGTTSPSEKLEVNGNISIGTSSQWIGKDNESNSFGFNASTGQYINSTASISLAIDSNNSDSDTRFFRIIKNSYGYGNGSELFRVNENGNVGIGTTSPDNLLTIESSGDTILQINRNDNTIGGGNRTGIIQFGAKGSWGTNLETSKIWSYAEETFTSTANGTSLRFFTTELGEATPTENMIIASNGNVGIGTTSPSEKLVVDGKIRSLGDTSSADFYSVGNDALLVNNGTSNMKFWNNGSERMRINSSGNVGIGTTTPGYKLDVNGNASFTGATRHLAGLYTSSTQTRDKISVWSSLGTYTIGMKNGFGYGGLGGDSTGTDYAMSFQMSNTSNRGWWWGDTSHTDLQGAMSLTTQGKLVVATSIKVGAGESTRSAGTSKLTVVAPLSSNGVGTDFQIDGGSGFSMANVQVEVPAYGEGIKVNSDSASSLDNTALAFYQGTTKVGSIVIRTNDTLYSTTSDYRLKENKENISDAIERVKALKPVKFNWISKPNQPKVDGFYAHELAEIVPEAVTGEKDALDYENNPDYQSIDQSKIVPLLSAALQQAIDKIEELEQRIQKLEK